MNNHDRVFEAVAKKSALEKLLTMAKRNPLAAAASLKVIREAKYYPASDMEPGVKFFILALEAAGIKTLFSCEGHPDGFYISIDTDDMSVGRRLVDQGFFSVTLEKTAGAGYQWVLRTDFEHGNRDEVLMLAAKAWVAGGLEPNWEKALQDSLKEQGQ